MGDQEKTIIRENIGTIVGNGNTQYINFEKKIKKLNIPVDDNLNSIVLFGRKFLKKWGEKKFLTIFVILLLVSLLIFLGSSAIIYKNYIQKQIFSGEGFNILIIVFILSIVSSSILYSLLYTYNTRTCKKCNKRFAYREHKRMHKGKVEYKNQIIHNLIQFLGCDFCGHQFEHEFQDIEEKESQ